VIEQGQRILLIEDDDADIQLVTQALRALDGTMEVQNLHDSDAVLAHIDTCVIEGSKPDLILLDWNLRGTDGQDILTAIRATDELSSTPVAVLSTSAAGDDVSTAHRLRANFFITKPATLDGYVAVMDQIVRFWFELVQRPARGLTPAHRQNPMSMPLPGEDISTSHWEDARHWAGVYEDMVGFTGGLLGGVSRDLCTLTPIAQLAASEDVATLRAQLRSHRTRLNAWRRRMQELQALWLDPEGRMIRRQGAQARLTRREYQFLQLLLAHPRHFFTTDQITSRAWGEPDLCPEHVRNYVRRIRKILADLDIPCELVNRSGCGYSLVFRSDASFAAPPKTFHTQGVTEPRPSRIAS
jgi:DNA-binding response OmpR family regulator